MNSATRGYGGIVVLIDYHGHSIRGQIYGRVVPIDSTYGIEGEQKLTWVTICGRIVGLSQRRGSCNYWRWRPRSCRGKSGYVSSHCCISLAVYPNIPIVAYHVDLARELYIAEATEESTDESLSTT